MRKARLLCGVVVFGLGFSATARAQLPVIDSAAIAQLFQQVQNGVSQLQNLQQQLYTAQQTYASLNGLTNINNLASDMNAARQYLPSSAAGLGDLVTNQQSGSYGSLSSTAAQIAAANRDFVPTPNADPQTSQIEGDMIHTGDILASTTAAGNQIYAAAQEREEGLEELRTQIGADPTPKEVQDLAARLQAETAEDANDATQLQGLQMQQEAALQAEQEQEREQTHQYLIDRANAAGAAARSGS